jgi:hypothetical protein
MSQPLATGRMMPAAPLRLAEMAMARTRSSSLKTLTRIGSVDGMMNAAPTPMTARHAMSCRISVEHAPSAVPKRKTSSASCRAPFRP